MNTSEFDDAYEDIERIRGSLLTARLWPDHWGNLFRSRVAAKCL